METEFEVRILDIDPLEAQQRVENAGGVLQKGRTIMRRYTYNTIPVDRNKWMRLRDDGSNIKLGIKHVISHEVAGTKEIEVGVASFEETAKLIEELGINVKSYQENYRTLFLLDQCEISIDEWPKIPAFLEVEGPDEKSVLEIVKKLGYDALKATSEDVSTIFEKHYQIMIDDIPNLTFKN